MKNLKAQSGITLIELLLVLTLLIIVIGISFNAFMSGLHSSSAAEDTVLIQQEANTLLTFLKTQHEKNQPYTVEMIGNNEGIKIIEGESTNQFNNTKFNYYICDLEKDSNSCEEQYAATDFSKTIHKPYEENFHLKIKVESKKDANIKFEVQTILSRL